MRHIGAFVFLLSAVTATPALSADTPLEWFEDRGWDIDDCPVDKKVPPEQDGGWISTFFLNPLSKDYRTAYWYHKKNTIYIHSALEPNVETKFGAKDFTKFYLLDVINRKCVSAFRTSFADEGNIVDITRGMIGKTIKKESPPNSTKNTPKTPSKSSSNTPGCEWGDCQNGVGGALLRGGNKYVGEWSKGMWHGYGMFLDNDGDVCEGQFRKSASEGPQFCLYKNGSLFFGRYARGTRSGSGFFVTSSGKVERMGRYSRGRLSREVEVDRDLIQADFDDIVFFAPEGLREKYIPKRLLNAKATDY